MNQSIDAAQHLRIRLSRFENIGDKIYNIFFLITLGQKMRKILVTAILGTLVVLTGCQAPATAEAEKTERMTLGTVQQSIHRGMSQSEVVEALGAPNMVTRDKDGTETWVYDKASTVATTTESAAYGTVILLGAWGGRADSVHSQRTLTLILKFKNSVLSDFTYRSTSF